MRMACGLLAGSTCALTGSSAAMRWSGLAVAILALVKLAADVAEARGTRPTGALRHSLTSCLIAYSLAVGLAAAIALLEAPGSDLAMLMVGHALIHGAGQAGANAPRPMLSFGQAVLTFVPIVVAACMLHSVALLVLAAILPLSMLSLAHVTVCVFRTLASQVHAVEERERLAQRLTRQARTCPITGLANRLALEEAAVTLFASREEGSTISLLWLDLHRFKDINDTLGHQVGDRVLREIAGRLRQLAPADAVVSRFGSDDFIVLAGSNDRQEGERLAEMIVRNIEQPLRVDGHRIETAASVGVAQAPQDATGFAELMQRADQALYHAKLAGRHQICFFDPAMSRDLVRRKRIEAELRGAIQRDELSIYFQPIIDLDSGRIRAFEALVRWFHPSRGELAPADFIPVAEECGVIVTLGNWIIKQAARACASWPEHVTLAVNLSPAQIRAPGAALGILAALRDARLDPARLELEVTESLFVEDNAETAAFMDELAAHGVRFSLDDFGTGYSSLHYINRFAFRTIKVDRSFVSGPHTGRKSDAIIRAVAEMGSTLEMDIVAEGLETLEQVEAVRQAGCTLGQGYYFSRPVPDHLAARLLVEEESTSHKPRRAG